ncbi:hypothetical protein MMPV_008771 [Pyropia vietnamensis]
MAVVNITSYYTRTVLGVGTSENHQEVPLRSVSWDNSLTPIIIRGGVEVEFKVRIDPTCEADEGAPSRITTLAASISLTTSAGTQRIYRSNRSWGWHAGRGALEPSPLWTDAMSTSPPNGADWLTHPPRRLTSDVSWAAVVKALPADVCDGVPSAAAAAAAAAGVSEEPPTDEGKSSWGTAQVRLVASMGGLAAAAVAAAMGAAFILRRHHRRKVRAGEGAPRGTNDGKSNPRLSVASIFQAGGVAAAGPLSSASEDTTMGSPPPAAYSGCSVPPPTSQSTSPATGGGSVSGGGDGRSLGGGGSVSGGGDRSSLGGGGCGGGDGCSRPDGLVGSTVSSAGMPAADVAATAHGAACGAAGGKAAEGDGRSGGGHGVDPDYSEVLYAQLRDIVDKNFYPPPPMPKELMTPTSSVVGYVPGSRTGRFSAGVADQAAATAPLLCVPAAGTRMAATAAAAAPEPTAEIFAAAAAGPAGDGRWAGRLGRFTPDGAPLWEAAVAVTVAPAGRDTDGSGDAGGGQGGRPIEALVVTTSIVADARGGGGGGGSGGSLPPPPPGTVIPDTVIPITPLASAMAAGAFYADVGGWSVGPPAVAASGTVTFATCLAYGDASRLRVWHHYHNGLLSAIDLCLEAPGREPPPPFGSSPRLDAADISGDWTADNLRVVLAEEGGRSRVAATTAPLDRTYGRDNSASPSLQRLPLGVSSRSVGLGWSAAPGRRVVLIRTMEAGGRLVKAAYRVERQLRRA